MPLIKHGKQIDDIWHEAEDLAEVQELLPMGPVIVDLETWQQHRADILALGGRIGLCLTPDQTPDLVAADIHQFELIALQFTKFTDGRAYSQARLLRERHGFKGELRAMGEVLRDQLTFMLRCGFDSFEFGTEQEAAKVLAAADEFAHWYQPALDGNPTIPALRYRGSQAAEAGCAAAWAY